MPYLGFTAYIWTDSDQPGTGGENIRFGRGNAEAWRVSGCDGSLGWKKIGAMKNRRNGSEEVSSENVKEELGFRSAVVNDGTRME
ncbi:hypothetical protein A2U01_0038847 [Trifolium medium]|uniref:Uncharacterized protein n=1 Tax=Trifolium medium TaxID=97028 RepID=A0A392Q145_9FABA|nr:hypothetical protein [Trifolium medium]